MFVVRSRLSIKLIILVTSAVIVAVAVCVALAVVQSDAAVRQEIDQRNTALAAMTADLLIEPVAHQDTEDVSNVLQMVVREDALEHTTLFDTHDAIITDNGGEDSAATDQGAENGADLTTEQALAQRALQTRQPQQETLRDQTQYAIPLLRDGQLYGVLVAQATVEGAADELNEIMLTMLAAGLAVVVIVALITTLLARTIARPLQHLAATAAAIGQGDLIDPPATTQGGEIGALTNAFRQMVVDLRAQRAAVTQRTDELQQSLAAQQRLGATVQQLSTPLLPVLPRVVLLPVVGHVDSARAQMIMQTMLDGVAQQRAQVAILDITGTAGVDTSVTDLLLKTMQAVTLLGAQPMLAGISAAAAQQLVAQEVDLSQMRTYKDVRAAIAAAQEITKLSR